MAFTGCFQKKSSKNRASRVGPFSQSRVDERPQWNLNAGLIFAAKSTSSLNESIPPASGLSVASATERIEVSIFAVGGGW
jgi:hypothetical protein